jgi:ribose transport system ATP-binding protein
MGESIFVARNVSKSFGPITVLKNVDLDICAGEVHGLVGQNGSGKSTFIKILSGFLTPDDGARLMLGGTEIPLPVRASEIDGSVLSFVHQDLALVEQMSVLDNVRLGQWETHAGRIAIAAERRRVSALLARFELNVSPDTLVERLSQADRAILALIRATDRIEGHPNSVLVLDEPTAYLPKDDVTRLFGAVAKVTASGSGVLFVSHRLDEVLEHTDRVTVLRDGAAIGTWITEETDEPELITQILGRSLTDLYPDATSSPQGDATLDVRGLSGGRVADLSFTVHAGEIFGVTGLAGMGQDDVPYLVYGSRRAASGTIGFPRIHASEHSISVSRRERLALVPANRLRDGCFPSVTMRENVSLPELDRYTRGFAIRRAPEQRATDALLARFEVRPSNFGMPMTSYSGGNQQKAVLAKWMQTDPRTLVLHEPTQGVDVGSRKQIFAAIREAADSGVAVLIVSAEYEDLAHLCDRVVVLTDGTVSAELSRDRLTTERLVEACYTGHSPASNGTVATKEKP